MDSERLSSRLRQPGHDRTFVTSETNFEEAARSCLDAARYEVVSKPRDLADSFRERSSGVRALGVVPDASITSRGTGRTFFVEIKKQAAGGNAEERSYKHHTVGFYNRIKAIYGYDYHPFVTIWCGDLATLPRYTEKARHLFERDQYFLWVAYELEPLREFLQRRCDAWLET